MIYSMWDQIYVWLLRAWHMRSVRWLFYDYVATQVSIWMNEVRQ